MNTWKSPARLLPVNGTTVWIRVVYLMDSPFKAVYDSGTQIFTSVDSSVNYPAYSVAKWKE